MRFQTSVTLLVGGGSGGRAVAVSTPHARERADRVGSAHGSRWPAITGVAHGVLSGFFSSDFFLRTSPSTRQPSVRRVGGPPSPCATPMRTRAHRPPATAPVHRAVLPPRPDLFGDERQERREQPQQRRQRQQHRAVGRAAASSPGRRTPRLDQFEVVVAEEPEERSRSSRAPACSRTPPAPSVASSTSARSFASMPRSSGCGTAQRGSGFARARTSTRSAASWPAAGPPSSVPRSKAVSAPGRPLAAQYRTPSDPCSSSSAIGVTTLPFDFDIFLRSGSSTKPEIAAFATAATSNSRCERSTVENSHVRMMSCACGRRSIGNVRANRSGRPPSRRRSAASATTSPTCP